MKLNYKKTIFVGFAFFLIMAFWQAYDAIVPLMLVNKFGLSQTLSGLVMALDNVLALFMLPLFGSLSDKCKSKYGKRTPYIVIGTVLAIVMFIGLTFADNVQLAQMKLDTSNPQSMEQLFEETGSITNAEKASVFDDSVAEEYDIKDYASLIRYNKTYAELSGDDNSGEKATVKKWYSNIGYEDEYCYKDGVYYPKQTVNNYVAREILSYGKYYSDLEKNEKKAVDEWCKNNNKDNKLGAYYLIDDSYVYKTNEEMSEYIDGNLYTVIVTPAISAYAWNKTLSNPVPLIFFVIALLAVLISMSIFRSPAVALMPDVTIKPLRSQGNAIINLMGTFGAMLVLVLGMVFGTGKVENQVKEFTWYIVAVCAIMAFGLAMFIAFVREPKWAKEMEEETDRLGIEEKADEEAQMEGGQGVANRRQLLSLFLILASVALWYTGYNAASTKYSLYATNVLHKDYNTTLLIAQAAAVIAYLPAGALSQKIGRKKSILLGIAFLTVAFFVCSFFDAQTPLFAINLVFACGGIGWATINVNSFPMVVELAKGGNVGKYTGYYYTASMAAQIITPILSGAVMDLFGSMRPLFYYSVIFIALSFVTMLFVKHGDAIKQEEIQQ